jgi:hypothetical protein
MESDYYFGGSPDDGSLIEPAVSAFLYDLTDSVIETHDSIAAPGSYVAAIISSCQVKYWGNSWRRADGADEIAYCVETTINPDSYLTARGATPDDYSESATQPASHSAARAHATWTWNMFDKS